MKPPSIFPIPKKYPAKFVMHGGPQMPVGGFVELSLELELLAADGYWPVGINRRVYGMGKSLWMKSAATGADAQRHP